MDLDGDDILDVISGRYIPGTVYWFRGAKDGTFGPRLELLPTEKGDQAAAMATANATDFDGDGDYDLIIGNVKGAVFLSRNEGTAEAPQFTTRVPLMVGEAPMKVKMKSDPMPVDWDDDDQLDLLVGDEVGDVTFFRGRSDGTFEPGVSLFTGKAVDNSLSYSQSRKRLDEVGRPIPGYRLRLATADWNADGKLDLIIGNCEEGPPTVDAEGNEKRGKTTGFVRVMLQR